MSKPPGVLEKPSGLFQITASTLVCRFCPEPTNRCLVQERTQEHGEHSTVGLLERKRKSSFPNSEGLRKLDPVNTNVLEQPDHSRTCAASQKTSDSEVHWTKRLNQLPRNQSIGPKDIDLVRRYSRLFLTVLHRETAEAVEEDTTWRKRSSRSAPKMFGTGPTESIVCACGPRLGTVRRSAKASSFTHMIS